MSIECRPGREADARAVVELLEQVSADSPFLGEYGIKPDADKFRQLMTAESVRLAALVAVGEEGLIVGYAHAVAGIPSTMRHIATVAIAVAEEARGQGVGRALLRELVATSRGRGWLRLRASLWANNEASRRLFAGAGFHQDAVLPDQLRDRDGTLVAELIYGRALD